MAIKTFPDGPVPTRLSAKPGQRRGRASTSSLGFMSPNWSARQRRIIDEIKEADRKKKEAINVGQEVDDGEGGRPKGQVRTASETTS